MGVALGMPGGGKLGRRRQDRCEPVSVAVQGQEPRRLCARRVGSQRPGRYVRAALAASGLAASRLELEITESVLLHDSNVILAILLEIKTMGVKISMDDFGTGYSSLSYLRSFPFDKVKIDRGFIKDLPQDRNAMAIVRAIVGLGETFGMSVTAEGVETDEQAVQPAQENCTHLQGYLFSKPIAATAVPGLIARLSDAAAPAVSEEDFIT
jgi:EAL domain-containing protein (putative c-di-GMP-specific phosphodiesterase class I)